MIEPLFELGQVESCLVIEVLNGKNGGQVLASMVISAGCPPAIDHALLGIFVVLVLTGIPAVKFHP